MGFGYTVEVLLDPDAAHKARGKDSFGWGGAYGTVSWTDPKNEITAVFLVQQPTKDVFADFEDVAWGDQWSTGADRPTLETVTSDTGRLFEPHQGAALRVRVPGGENTGMSLTYKFMDELGEEPEEIWFRYYLRFAEDWEPSDGSPIASLPWQVAQMRSKMALPCCTAWFACGSPPPPPPQATVRTVKSAIRVSATASTDRDVSCLIVLPFLGPRSDLERGRSS